MAAHPAGGNPRHGGDGSLSKAAAAPRGLWELAKLYGVQTAFYGVDKLRRDAGPEAVLAALRGLGAPIEHHTDIDGALRQRRAEIADRIIEPVLVAWDGRLARVDLRLPPSALGVTTIEIGLEGGGHITQTIDGGRARSFRLVRRLPSGYHHLRLRAGKLQASALVVSAPARAYTCGSRGWGVFMPLYSLRSERSWGSGNYHDLCELIDWTADLGGTSVATLPLFASYLDEPFDPSPYSPASRLFWNEFFVDLESLPELAESAPARRLIASAQARRAIAALRSGDIVDYRAGMALKRRVLELLADPAFASASRRAALGAFRRDHPGAEDYARFRAVMETRGEPWPDWPEPLRGGTIGKGDVEEAAIRYHLYAQFVASEQMAEVSRRARGRGVRLYLDMPLGAGRDSYDVWRERDSFATGLSAGAPPDAFFSFGQDWGFPPVHPENSRKSGYRYWIAALRHLMSAAGVLRIDHVMGLHRLYCIPAGLGAREGLYVRYHADELYAILSLESHRTQTLVVGEDLGTVPPYVRPAMRRHAVHRSFVAQFRLRPDKDGAMPEPPPLSVASLNTHDMPTFAAFWQGAGIDDRLALGLLCAEEAEAEHSKLAKLRGGVIAYLRGRRLLVARHSGPAAVQRALLLAMGEGKARIVLANLEDLWLETEPQNVPGTNQERPNWRRKSRYSLEEMRQLDEVTEPLLALDAARRGKRTRRQ